MKTNEIKKSKYKRYFLYEQISGTNNGMMAVFGELRHTIKYYNMEVVASVSPSEYGVVFKDRRDRITENREFIEDNIKITPITKEENPEYFL